ncbi:hypothetical protein DESC_780083 [Desulfosarcina cetonica]|nr:hypothetical protein DESC_780083 [Desulfosarcina cetonica]
MCCVTGRQYAVVPIALCQPPCQGCIRDLSYPSRDDGGLFRAAPCVYGEIKLSDPSKYDSAGLTTVFYDLRIT